MSSPTRYPIPAGEYRQEEDISRSRFITTVAPAHTVAEAQDVKAGEELCVVEAMKMMNILLAERDGKVAKIHAKSGDSLAVDQVIVEFA